MFNQDPIFFPFRILDPGVKKAPDPGSGSATLKNIFTTGNRSKNRPRKIQKPFWNAGNQVYLFLLVNFYFLCSRIQIRILNTDPDPGQPNECGSGIPDPQHCYKNTSRVSGGIRSVLLLRGEVNWHLIIRKNLQSKFFQLFSFSKLSSCEDTGTVAYYVAPYCNFHF